MPQHILTENSDSEGKVYLEHEHSFNLLGSFNHIDEKALNSNKFTGTIPPTLGLLSNLFWLDLADNQLTGSIPVSTATTLGLDQLTHTKHFHFNKNQLSGTLTGLFNSNMSLIHILFDSNQLTGPDTRGARGHFIAPSSELGQQLAHWTIARSKQHDQIECRVGEKGGLTKKLFDFAYKRNLASLNGVECTQMINLTCSYWVQVHVIPNLSHSQLD
ncbi:Leucine-rich repeat protein kinase family protein [Zea mays]|uniref:Leucine-rich repeat protein kinase family protein n=1 Tax=Zea mays TaxID=4577 RepID=A0A1D6FUW5_MAIZE|nr:Leucine-rich repeat protein kinase family protein [Zea mays]